MKAKLDLFGQRPRQGTKSVCMYDPPSLLAGPQALLAGPQAPLAGPQAPLKGPQAPLAGPHTWGKPSRQGQALMPQGQALGPL